MAEMIRRDVEFFLVGRRTRTSCPCWLMSGFMGTFQAQIAITCWWCDIHRVCPISPTQNKLKFQVISSLCIRRSELREESRKMLVGNISPSHRRYWTGYIIFFCLVFATNGILTYFIVVESEYPLKIIRASYLLPPFVYVLESILTRNWYIKFFVEIKAINSILQPATREHVLQLSPSSKLKIIFVLSLLITYQVIMSAKCFIFGDLILNA